MSDEHPDRDIYEHSLQSEFERVMANDVAAKYGYDTAKSYGMNEDGRLRAAIVSLSNAKRNLVQRTAGQETSR